PVLADAVLHEERPLTQRRGDAARQDQDDRQRQQGEDCSEKDVQKTLKATRYGRLVHPYGPQWLVPTFSGKSPVRAPRTLRSEADATNHGKGSTVSNSCAPRTCPPLRGPSLAMGAIGAVRGRPDGT